MGDLLVAPYVKHTGGLVFGTGGESVPARVELETINIASSSVFLIGRVLRKLN
jgi:hypothetical protein